MAFFSEMTGLAIKHQAVNLGQLNHQLDPLSEIVVTVGATEAIYSTVQAFAGPGDEVILMQPFYDSYPASITLAGAKPVVVTLAPRGTPGSGGPSSGDWHLDLAEVRAAIRPGKTKLLFLNNPHNPIGKVWAREELEAIAAIAVEFDLIVVADEVYETLVFSDSPSPMIKFASLPGMFERTITIGSIGKMFGVTGWKIGWVLAAPPLARALWMVHQFVPFSVATPLQEAAARALEHATDPSSGFFETTAATYQHLRDRLIRLLARNGLTPTRPDGGYFVLADTTRLDPLLVGSPELAVPASGRRPRDFAVCRHLTVAAGVTAIPPSAFYDRAAGPDAPHLAVPSRLARFAFCKGEDLLEDADRRLADYFGSEAAGGKP
ncbi:hypothetical protein HK405_011800 [Cladochytrium tenue]|nr:hypothetical protein HK405_011800 [Cladochytrium tenue]